jgi:hypothetical protein
MLSLVMDLWVLFPLLPFKRASTSRAESDAAFSVLHTMPGSEHFLTGSV